MPISMQAKRAFRYAGRALKVGSTFEARTEADAIIFVAIGNASRVVAPPPPLPQDAPAQVGTQTKRGRGYRKQALEAQPASDATPESSTESASQAQPSESGTVEKPEPGTLEATQNGDAGFARNRYKRRDMAGGGA